MPCSLIDSTFMRRGGAPEPVPGRALGPADWLIEPFEPIG